MATCSYRILNCHTQNHNNVKPSVSHKFVHFSASYSSLIKPKLKFPEIPNLIQDAGHMIKKTSIQLLDALVDLTFQFFDQPLLPSQSNFAPIEEIGGRVDVDVVEGRIPDDFPQGVYVRNGSNPYFGASKSAKSLFGKSSEIWIEGEGMLHALYFSKDGHGTWTISYNNRYVQTETFRLEKERNKPAFLPCTEGDPAAVLSALVLNMLRFGRANKDLSNTSIFEHSGKYYSISENHMPQEIDISTLDTLGNWELSEFWNRPFTSHSTKVPGSGELVITGFDAVKPHFELGVVSVDGKKIIHRVDLNYSRCTFCHEIGITQKYNVIMDFPLILDINRLIRGGSLIRYEKEQFARIGIMPRYGDADSVEWFKVETCCVFHIFNCFEEDDEVVVRGCQAGESIIPGPDLGMNKLEWFSQGFKHPETAGKNQEHSQLGSFFTRAHEWRLNMKTRMVKEKNLTGTDFSMEFPLINEGFIGIKNQYGYAQVVDSAASSIAGIVKYGGLAKLYFDELNQSEFSMGNGQELEEIVKVEYHMLPRNTFCSGAVFVPKPESLEEDDGWIVSFVHHEESNKSEAYIVDAKKFSSQPIARIALPSRVPYGFHGTFIASLNL